MDQTTFNAKNISDGDKSRFLNAFNEARTSVQMAFFEADGTCYTATNENGPYGPLFKLCSTGFKNFKAIANYDFTSASELGAMMLHRATCERYKAGPGKSLKIAAKTFKSVEIKVAKDLRSEYPIPDNVSPIISDIQSESASVKNNGKYTSCGTRTVHRLYLATAFTILHKLHAPSSRDGIVALIVEKNGRIISWGRKNPDVTCWHGETSAIIALGGTIPAGSSVYSTLKPCNMCAGTINDASAGNAKVFWGQDDPGSMAADTKLEQTRVCLMGIKPKRRTSNPARERQRAEDQPNGDCVRKELRRAEADRQKEHHRLYRDRRGGNHRQRSRESPESQAG